MAPTKKGGKDEVWAPITSQLKGGTEGHGPVSFEAYFLRDLYQRGKINDALIGEIIKQNQLSADPKDVIAAIKDNSGTSIPTGLSHIIADIARAIPAQN